MAAADTASAAATSGGVIAVVAFWGAASVVGAAVAVGAFLLLAEPVTEVTAMWLRWRESKREQRST